MLEHRQCSLNRGCLLYGVSVKGGSTVLPQILS